MFESAVPKPPVPGTPVRKDPNPPAKQPVKKAPPVKEDTQEKHYINPHFTMDPTKEKYPEVPPAHGPESAPPAKGPVTEEPTKRIFTGSPYPDPRKNTPK
jgi:hypothetical protein